MTDREFNARALELVSHLEAQDEAYPFLTPVDYKALNLADYPIVIKKPMDLSTVRKRIKTGRYNEYSDVLADLRLIWENCRTYNMAGSVRLTQGIVEQANAMDEHQKKYCQKHKLSRAKRPRESEPEVQPRQLSDAISFEEKVEFSEKVRMISHESLTALVEIVSTDCPVALEELDAERMQIKVDALDRRTFNKVVE